ncbi:hypothetical protein BDY19DRAFT_586427 [Irpex rosettiformis]|uniref:Uncharacterized protein n=1 Tax=Irpex rosettiformis TaxID=378272 RepID=A0ACB8UD41_9APHY|nr:hypothetical protein BDY19DRAFT_586427 [Irpex rosettiformis]
MDACKPYQGVRSGLPPTARSPIANSFDQARNRSITLPAFSASASSPIPSTPQGQGIPRKWSTPVIDLTQDDNGKVDNAPTAFVEQRVMKRRRTEDDLPRHGPPSSTHLDMRAMGTAINTLDQQARLLPFASLSVNTTPVTTPLVDVLLPAQPPSASVSLTPATEGVLTAEPKVMVANAEENEEEEEDEDTEMTDIWDENGLVKIEICIDAAFDEVEGKIICKMCEFRSQNFDGTSSEPMTDTSQDALVKHCEVEHPAGWGTLRRGNRQEKQEEEPSSMSKDVPVKDG